LHFEKIETRKAIYTVRVDKNYRLALRPKNGNWELLRISTHDDVYRNPGV